MVVLPALSSPRTRMRASRLPETDEKSRVNTIPMSSLRGAARPRGSARVSGLGARALGRSEGGREEGAEIWWGRRGEGEGREGAGACEYRRRRRRLCFF